MNHEDEDGYSLLMPFVTVASKGGPHDDDSYVAGYEMGELSGVLEHGKPGQIQGMFHSVNLAQLDLIAMRFGYSVVANGDAEWTQVLLVKIQPALD